VEGSVRIFAGGPVQPDLGFIIHSPEYRRAETRDIDGRIAVTTTLEVLRDIANNKGPEKKLIALGYAGWASGQLEGELKLEAWYTAPADPKIVFDDDREKVWDNAMAKRPRDI
jgi:putative transcriptional regulator